MKLSYLSKLKEPRRVLSRPQQREDASISIKRRVLDSAFISYHRVATASPNSDADRQTRADRFRRITAVLVE